MHSKRPCKCASVLNFLFSLPLPSEGQRFSGTNSLFPTPNQHRGTPATSPTPRQTCVWQPTRSKRDPYLQTCPFQAACWLKASQQHLGAAAGCSLQDALVPSHQAISAGLCVSIVPAPLPRIEPASLNSTARSRSRSLPHRSSTHFFCRKKRVCSTSPRSRRRQEHDRTLQLKAKLNPRCERRELMSRGAKPQILGCKQQPPGMQIHNPWGSKTLNQGGCKPSSPRTQIPNPWGVKPQAPLL